MFNPPIIAIMIALRTVIVVVLRRDLMLWYRENILELDHHNHPHVCRSRCGLGFGEHPSPTTLRVKLSLNEGVWEIGNQVATQLGRPRAEIRIWKLQNTPELDDTGAVQNICDSRRLISYIATEVEPNETFSSVFTGPFDDKLIFVACHADPPENDRKRKGEETTSQYYKRIRNLPDPSALAKGYHESPDNSIFLNHHPFDVEGIPTELLHPAFGRFRDHCSTIVPLQCDIQLTLAMCREMSKMYPSEEDRLASFKAVIKKHFGVCLHGVWIGKAITNVTAINDRHYSFNVEAKIINGDPYIRNTAYYTKQVAGMPRSEPLRLPIILIDVTGPIMTISGAINGSKITMDPYIVVNLATPSHDIPGLVPIFAALREMILESEAYYTSKHLLPVTDEQRRFPYFNSSGDATFLYQDHLAPGYNRLLFLAGITSTCSTLTNGTFVVVKFSHTYGTAAQIATAELGFAPKIYYHESLPGGWTVVVMERIAQPFKLLQDMSDSDCAVLRPALTDAVSKMHAAGFVHGDLRRGNIFGDVQTSSLRSLRSRWYAIKCIVSMYTSLGCKYIEGPLDRPGDSDSPLED